MKLVECVPNFSEGRRKEAVQEIAQAIEKVQGVKLLDISMDPDHNRSVLTFLGQPEAIKEAAFQACKKAVDLIDLNKHLGQHPRIGACDVIPFVPLLNISLKECIEIARDVGERIWRELRVPVYLYGEAAQDTSRRRLPPIRKGGFECLKEEINLPERRPDIGEQVCHPTAGAIAIGVRDFLIAFNVNLDTSDLKIAQEIARSIRESSGGLPALQARGMLMASRGFAQVSMNLLDFKKTSLLDAFEAVKKEAEAKNVGIRNSEIIGLLPWEAVNDLLLKVLKLDDFSIERILEWRIEREFRYDRSGEDQEGCT